MKKFKSISVDEATFDKLERLTKILLPGVKLFKSQVIENLVKKEKKKMKHNKTYNYVQATRSEDHGSRTYDVAGMKLPSVTTVLAKTKDQTYIRKWKERVGEKQAEYIKNYSSKRGTAMHKFLEKYIQGAGYDDLTPIGQEAKSMALKIIEVGLTPITEYYGSEVTVHYPGLYAGSTDLVCMHNDMQTIVDFKQSNRPKREEWIEDYCIQIGAYAMAHDYIYGSNIRQGVIMVCTPDLYYQEFKFQDRELRDWKHKFLSRLDMYYKLDQTKEQKKYKNWEKDLTELLEEFEANKIMS